MLWYWFKVRHIDQQNTTENSEINLCSYGQLIFDKGCQDSGEKSLQQITLGQLDTHLQKSEVRAPYHSYTKIKLIKYIHTRAKTIKLLEKNTGVNLHDFGLGNSFLNMTRKAQVTKQNKKQICWTPSKLKTFELPKVLPGKDPQSGRKYFQIVYLIKDWYLEYIKNS